jgi:acetyl esterase/lipase
MADSLLSNDYSDDETLLTQKSLQLSLAPPRSPPFGTALHSLLVGTSPSANNDPYADHQDDQAHSDYNNQHSSSSSSSSGIRERLMHLIYNARRDGTIIPHPHVPVGPEGSDQVTRFLGSVLPLSWHNYVRDSGGFRSISDTVVTCSIPAGAVANPGAAVSFLRLTRQMQTIPYGDHHESQFMDMFFPECSRQELRGLVFFVHGGAWGSGKPWFYRLIALPFLKLNLAVAIVGYRTYPSGDVNTQVRDLNSAYQELSKRYPDLCGPFRSERPIGVCVMGHSSGAHLALLMVVEQTKQLLQVEQSRLESSRRRADADAADDNPTRLLVDSVVGISGPYDISHHFDYEAARGVEELSPMKACNGYTREQFRLNTPSLRLQDFLITWQESDSHLVVDRFFPRTLLLHGIEDDTVPFTATSEAARILRSCGVTRCDEYYAPLTGHQDIIMHLMLGGRAQTAIVKWLDQSRDGSTSQSLRSRL